MNKLLKIFKSAEFYLAVIVIIGFLLRLYKIDNPVADWHSWRQADTAAVARNFFKEGFTPLVPIYDDMSANSDTPGPNPHRYRFVEFPIYNSLVYSAYVLNGGIDERLARLVSVIFSLFSMVFIYLIAKKAFGKFVGLISSLIYAVLPYSIFYSRVILPEPALVCFCLGMFYFTQAFIEKGTVKLFLISSLFAALAFLIKPMAIFYLLPLGIWVLVKERNIFSLVKKYLPWTILVALPFVLWRIWINGHPEGIPASSWLLNGNGIRLRPAFWRWIVVDRFDREILSACGFVFFVMGLLFKLYI
jgi:hypothetical protein